MLTIKLKFLLKFLQSSAYLSEPSASIAYFIPLKPLGHPCCSPNISNSFPPQDLVFTAPLAWNTLHQIFI